MVKRISYHMSPDEGFTPRITLTPLIDTALVLLVIFMVATPLLDKHIKVDLPLGGAPDEREKTTSAQPLTVVIDRQGTIYCQEQAVSLAELRTIIEEKIAHDNIKGVIVAADQQVSYGVPFSVVDMLKTTGLESVLFSERPGSNS